MSRRMAISRESSSSSPTAGNVGAVASNSGLPSTIHLYAIQDLTGAAGKVGVDDENGYNMAIQQITTNPNRGTQKLESAASRAGTPLWRMLGGTPVPVA